MRFGWTGPQHRGLMALDATTSKEQPMWHRAALMFLTIVFLAAPALAVDPAIKCEAAKLKEAGKYGFCRLKAESKAVIVEASY